MLEYDTNIALRHSFGESQMSFPKSVVLYLNHSKNTPDYENCTLHFQDGSSHLYQVPVMKVQKYSPHEIEEKHLNLLIPFLPIRFARRIKSNKEAGRKKLKEDLTEFLAECIMILNREKESGVLTECAWNDIMEFLYKACGHLLEKEPELLEEVYEGMEPAIKLNREIIKELQDDKKVLSKQLESGIIKLIQRLKNEGKDIEAAREALEDVFSLDKKEAKAKAELYWKKK